MQVKLGFQFHEWTRFGLKSEIEWNPDGIPHLLIAGTTGGGKTVLTQYIMNQLLSTDADIYICDFKAGGDWDGIFADDRYAEYVDCDRIVDKFYGLFTDAIKEKRKSNKFLFFDEFPSYVLAKDNKAQKETMEKFGHIAFMGRSFGFHIILIGQQYSSKIIDTNIREQFGIKVYAGTTISSESSRMLFPNSEIDKSKPLPKHCGYVATQEQELEIIRFPYVLAPNKLKMLLIQKASRYRAKRIEADSDGVAID